MGNARLFLISAIAVQSLDAEAATLRVPADFTTIQAAMNAAQPRDTILVAAGSYNENVTITTSRIRLIGGGSGSPAVVEGTGLTGPGIHVRSSRRSAPLTQVEISGMAVRNFENVDCAMASSPARSKNQPDRAEESGP